MMKISITIISCLWLDPNQSKLEIFKGFFFSIVLRGGGIIKKSKGVSQIVFIFVFLCF